MMKDPFRGLGRLLVVCSAVAALGVGESQTVKITPLGSHQGELCRNDRALLMEDPTGVRILYDPGRTVDETDARLGDVHVLLLSHVHPDHIGDAKPNRQAPGTCAVLGTVSAAPNTVLAAIAAAKNSAVIAGGEMAEFAGRKIQNIRGSATAGCPATGLTNEMIVPLAAPCTTSARPGGSVAARFAGAPVGVKFANIQALHSNGIQANLVEDPGVPAGIRAYGGNDGGFVVKFTNGLSVYLTSDTGMFGDMKTIVRDYYRPQLAVINMGDVTNLGPDEAAFAAKRLIQPRTVIASHINEAATSSGAPTGPRMMRFLEMMKAPSFEPIRSRGFREPQIGIVIPLSGVTREFDRDGRCVNCP